MTATPYVATPTGDWAAGSPELSDVKGLYDDIATDHDALASVFDAGGFALDVLGDIGDPLGAVLSSAIGWAIDHVSFLREPVDWLAGDPSSIQAATTTWTNVSTGMRTAAQTYADGLSALDAAAWSGDAADAYRKKAGQLIDALSGSATMAELEGAVIAATGGLCAAFRGAIFNAISEFAEQMVIRGLIALANSTWSFGASIAAWVIDLEIEAGLLSARIGAKIAELVEKAGRIAETLGKDGSKLQQIGEKLVRLSESMMHDARSARSRLGWDRRGHGATHLMQSLDAAGRLTHGGLAGTVLDQGKNVAEVVTDPTPEHVGDLAGGATKAAAKHGADQARDAVRGDHRS